MVGFMMILSRYSRHVLGVITHNSVKGFVLSLTFVSVLAILGSFVPVQRGLVEEEADKVPSQDYSCPCLIPEVHSLRFIPTRRILELGY